MDQPTLLAGADAAKELGEWTRKIVEVYMSWYAFFGGANVLALGWIFGTEVKDSVRPMLKPICVLFCALNVLGTTSTLFVGFTTARYAREFHDLIVFAAFANSLGLLGFGYVWLRCWRIVSAQPEIIRQ